MFLTQLSASPVSVRQTSTRARRLCHEITDHVAGEFGLDPAAVTSPTRGAPQAAFARQVAMYLAHIGFALSFETIGRVFGRDRTTVAHACRVVEDSRDDVGLDRRLSALERMCAETASECLQGAADVSI
ncbi:MAG: DNA replication initiation protein [Proteobacteria bacterium]|nr:DNA replication initiation protein [Pseudomonadota bacterium]